MSSVYIHMMSVNQLKKRNNKIIIWKKHISPCTAYKHQRTSIALDKFSIVEGETLKCPWPVRSNRIETIQIPYKQRSQNSFTKQLCFKEALSKLNLVILNLKSTITLTISQWRIHKDLIKDRCQKVLQIYSAYGNKDMKEKWIFFKKMMPNF